MPCVSGLVIRPVGKPAMNHASSPRYQQIARVLKRAILDGGYPVGARLPTEGELASSYEVSRHTVREALRVLRNDGLVSSRQGAGTVVCQPPHTDSDIHQVMSINDLLTFAADARFEPDEIGMTTIGTDTATRIGVEAGSPWLSATGLRLDRDDQPLCWTEYYIQRNYASVGRVLSTHRGPVFPLLESLFGLRVVEVDQQISATLLSAELAGRLGEPVGSPALEVRRRYKTADGQCVQVTVNIHPAARFTHSMTIRRLRS